MANANDICNGVMIKLGKKPSITSLKGTSSEERIFASLFDRTLRIAIRKYRPNCCVARAILSQDPNFTPRHTYASGYKYPANMVKLLDVNDAVDWREKDNPIEGEWILSHTPKPIDAGYAAPDMRVKYLEHKPVEQLDDDFGNMFELELAVAAAPAIDQTREAFVIALRNTEADRWAADNAMENGFEVVEVDPLFGVERIVRS